MSDWCTRSGPWSSSRGPQRHGCRMVAARTHPRHRHPGRVAAERGSVGRCPGCRHVGIVEGDGELVVRGEAVVDRHHDDARPVRQLAAVRVVGIDAAVDPSAAVEPHADGQRPCVVRYRNVDPHGNVAVRPRHKVVAHRSDLRPRLALQRLLPRAQLRRRYLVLGGPRLPRLACPAQLSRRGSSGITRLLWAGCAGLYPGAMRSGGRGCAIACHVRYNPANRPGSTGA